VRRFSVLLIRLLGTRRYLRIPQRWRRSLGMVCGQDFSEVNAALRRLRDAQRREGNP
jgi:hypothetical protein